MDRAGDWPRAAARGVVWPDAVAEVRSMVEVRAEGVVEGARRWRRSVSWEERCGVVMVVVEQSGVAGRLLVCVVNRGVRKNA